MGRRGEPAGGKGELAIVGKDLNGRAVNEDTQISQVITSRGPLGSPAADGFVRKAQRQLRPVPADDERIVQQELERPLGMGEKDVGTMLSQRERPVTDKFVPHASKRLELVHRPLEQGPVFARHDLARDREAVAPRHVVGRPREACLGHAHPANQDGAAGLVHEALRCVEVKAVVP